MTQIVKKAAILMAVVVALGLAVTSPAVAYDWIEWPVSEGGNGHRYALTSVEGSWEDAEEEAVGINAHLVTINNADEDYFLGNHEAFPIAAYWIGFTDQFEEGHWVWIGEVENPGEHWDGGWWEDGNPNSTSYVNWALGEPNNGGGAEDWGTITDHTERDWNDLRWDASLYGIIEVPEPATLSLLLFGGIVALKRRR